MVLKHRLRMKLMILGTQVQEARVSAGLTQTAAAERIGMTRGNYARIEYGKSNVTIETLVRVAEGLGLEVTVTLAARAKRPGS